MLLDKAIILKILYIYQAQWFIPLMPALGRQRQEDLCKFEASLIYITSYRTARATQRDPNSKQQQDQKPPTYIQNTKAHNISIKSLQI